MKAIFKKRWVRVLVIPGLIFFLVMQLFAPRIDNLQTTGEIVLPDPVKNIFEKACYNCHSNITRLAWFDRIAPASWLVADHVRRGRAALNFSQWDKLTPVQQKAVLFESLNQMQFGMMPLGQYTFFHPEAKISDKESKVVQGYLETLLVVSRPDTAKTQAWNRQFVTWKGDSGVLRNPPPAPNGIAFMPDYKDWVSIASTERVDNGTMRIIAGNAIAINAIKTRNSQPWRGGSELWPDGSVLVKIIWVQLADSSGLIQTGEFRQTDFMVKDKNKYRETGGWGFARWAKGLQLAPYGKDAAFATECINCHRSMKDQDFVFTTPIDLDPALEGKVLSSFIDKKNGTMSTLYGGKDSVLALVTWAQVKNPHWFGSIITGRIKSIEKVRSVHPASILP